MSTTDDQDQNDADASSKDGNSSDGSSNESNDGSGDGSQDGSGGGSKDASGSSDSEESKNALEWGVTFAGAAIVLFALGYFLYSWATIGPLEAELVIDLQEPRQVGDIIEVPIEVHNRGTRVAEAAVVEVCGEPDSCAQLTFSYIPFESTVKGQVGLDAPLGAPLTSRMVSYRKP